MDEGQPTIVKPTKPKRRWFQYSLRTLLIVMTIIAVGLGWWSHKARQQREAVAALEKAGGLAVYDFQERQLDKPPYWPRWLIGILGIDYFADVTAAGSTEIFPALAMTNAALEPLGALPRLRALNLDTTQISDEGMQHLKRFHALEWLNLNSTQVTDAGLEQLKDLRGLKELNLTQTRVTDAGVKRLKQALPNCDIRH